jgi:putative tricarboxylic transport membrane protein
MTEGESGTVGTNQEAVRASWLARKDVLAGLMFMTVAVLGLWASRDYPVGTAVRMSTGYVPRLLCWLLLALGAAVLLQGYRAAAQERGVTLSAWRPLVFVPASLIVFAFAMQPLGLVAATLLLIGIGSLAGREAGWLEVLVAGLLLLLLTLGIFVWGLGLPIPVWPDW